MSSMGTSSEKIKKRHPHGHPGLDLPQDEGLLAVGKLVGQLHPTVDRSRMHDHRVILREREDVTVQAIPAGIFS
jgi:hypothetical protein